MNNRSLLIVLLILYALLVGYTETIITLGQMPSQRITPFNTFIGFSFALLHASQRMGWKRAWILLACVFVVSLTFESVGVATGWIYGPYHYTAKLGPLFLGLVPLLIPIAWFMMMYPSFVIADWLIPASSRGRQVLAVAAVGGLVMTAWDVVMDPTMVASGHWIWEVNGVFFGIPLQNFWGWWLTTFVSFLVFLWWAGRSLPLAAEGKFDRLTVILYALTGLIGSTLGAWLGGMGGPALAGFFAIIPWVVIGWLKMSG